MFHENQGGKNFKKKEVVKKSPMPLKGKVELKFKLGPLESIYQKQGQGGDTGVCMQVFSGVLRAGAREQSAGKEEGSENVDCEARKKSFTNFVTHLKL